MGLVLTIALGLSFTCIQAYEYMHAPFHYAGHIYGATFFMATGFHGAHVIIGSIFLIVCLIRALAGQFTPKQHLGFEFAAWYWHFRRCRVALLVRLHICVGSRRIAGRRALRSDDG